MPITLQPMPISKKLSWKEKIEIAVRKDGAMSALRLLSGIGIGMAVGAASLGATLAVCAGIVVLSASAEYVVEKYRKKRLLDIYCEEVAAVVKKPESEVTVDDLDLAAKPKEQGGYGIVALQKALDLHRYKRNAYIGFHAIAAGLMATGIGIVAFAVEAIPTVVLAGAAGALHDGVFSMVKTVGNMVYKVDDSRTVTNNIREICDQISLGGQISTTRVLGVFVEANPELAASIRERFKEPYTELTINTKRQLVKELDAQYHIYQLTDDINSGRINPTELGFAAYGQSSGLPRRDDATRPYRPPVAANDIVRESQPATRVEAESVSGPVLTAIDKAR